MSIFNMETADLGQTPKVVPVNHRALPSAPLGGGRLLYAMAARAMTWTEANHGVGSMAAGGSGFPARLPNELSETTT